MKRFIYITLLLVCGSRSASALEINTISGNLANYKMKLELTSDPVVAISGTANVVDLELLKYISGAVETLDLSGLTVEAYAYPTGAIVDQHEFAAGELPPYMLAGSKLKKFAFPANTSIIGKGVFTASKLESAILPAGVASVGDYAFSHCHSLKTVKFEGMPKLGTGLFKDCIQLTSVKTNSSLTAWPAHTFDGCSDYAEQLPSSVTTVGDYAYRGTALSTLNLRNVKKIGDFAFSEMPLLESVIYSNSSAISLGTGVFFNDKELESLPIFISDIAPLTLAHTQGKTDMIIRSAAIGEGAYANNPSIDTLILGPEVRTVARNAFRNLSSLKLVDVSRLDGNIPDTHQEAFSGLENADGRYDIKLNVRPGNEEAWGEHPLWSLFEIGHFDTGVTDVSADFDRIEVCRFSDRVEVSADKAITYLGIFSLDGVMIGECSPIALAASLDGIPESGVIIVKVVAGDVTKIVKML